MLQGMVVVPEGEAGAEPPTFQVGCPQAPYSFWRNVCWDMERTLGNQLDETRKVTRPL